MKDLKYANGGEAGGWKIGDKFRVLKGIYGDYNSPRYANQEFEVINIRDGKYIDARNKKGNTETFDSKNIEKISFADGGDVGGYQQWRVKFWNQTTDEYRDVEVGGSSKYDAQRNAMDELDIDGLSDWSVAEVTKIEGFFANGGNITFTYQIGGL